MNTKILTIETNTTYNKLLNDENLTFEELCKTIQNHNVKKFTKIFLLGIFGKNSPEYKAEIFCNPDPSDT